MSKTLARLVYGAARLATGWQSRWRAADTRIRAADLLCEVHTVDTRHGPISFRATHTQALGYLRELETREPETLAWIDAFETPCVFWDVGANVGAYSLYAARRPGVTVLAFEPAAASYAALCENIRLSGLDDRLRAFCLALTDRTTLATLDLAWTNPGSVANAFDAGSPTEGRGHFRQGMLGYSIDDLRSAFDLPVPDYVKIDVDGIEDHIVAGAAETLADPRLRGLLIEIAERDRGDDAPIVTRIRDAGFRIAAASTDNVMFAREA